MYKYLYLVLLLLTPLWATAQVAQSFSFTLRGQLDPSINAPAKVYLAFNGWFDSATVTHGRFELQRRVDKHYLFGPDRLPAPGMGALLLSRTGRGVRQEWDGPHVCEAGWREQADMIVCYIEPGVITFSSSDSLREARVRGPHLNTDWQELLKTTHPYPIDKQSIDITTLPALARFVVSHPASLVSLDQVKNLLIIPRYSALTRQLFTLLAPALRRSPKGQLIAKQLTTWRYPVGIGQQAPLFKLPRLNRDSVGYFGVRRWILLNFYASTPAAYLAQNEEFLQVVKVIYEQKRLLVRQFIGSHHTPPQLSHFSFAVCNIAVDGPNVRAAWLAAGSPPTNRNVLLDQPGPHSVATLYQVTTTPQNFLLDGAGRIIAKNISSKKLQALLEEELQRVLKE